MLMDKLYPHLWIFIVCDGHQFILQRQYSRYFIIVHNATTLHTNVVTNTPKSIIIDDNINKEVPDIIVYLGDIQEPRNVWPKVGRVTAKPKVTNAPSAATAPHQLRPRTSLETAASQLHHSLPARRSPVPEPPIHLRMTAGSRPPSHPTQSECSHACRPAASPMLTHSSRSTGWSQSVKQAQAHCIPGCLNGA